MDGEGIFSWIFLAISLFFILFRGGKKAPPPKRQPPTFSKSSQRETAKPLQIQKNPPSSQTLASSQERKKVQENPYAVKKARKPLSLLSKNWKKNTDFKKAFLLSEVLKRPDEKGSFFHDDRGPYS